jgi:N-glycosidase YbiA
MPNERNLYFGVAYDKENTEPINFVENRFHDLSPFSAHRIEIWGEVFATFEHAYQAARIKKGPEHDAIKNAKSPLDAWREGQKYKNREDLLVENYDKDAVVEELFRAKLAQHEDVRDVLKETGNRELLKIYPTDYYWGTGADGSGENKMGKLWMKIRDELV